MKGIGKMICSMGLVRKLGLMVHTMRENIMRVENMGKVLTNGLMEVLTVEIGETTKLKERANMCGWMGDHMMVHGKTITCMVKVYMLGRMEGSMKASMS